jgi:putative transposase
VKGQICYLWAAIDVDTNEILAVYASRGRGIPNAIEFLRKVLDSCEGKPVIVVDRGPWYRWALERLGITYFHETFGNRNRIDRETKNRTKRFYNNINAKTLKSIEELVTAIAAMHNFIRAGGEEVIPT